MRSDQLRWHAERVEVARATSLRISGAIRALQESLERDAAAGKRPEPTARKSAPDTGSVHDLSNQTVSNLTTSYTPKYPAGLWPLT
jgi:hypothetical protein